MLPLTTSAFWRPIAITITGGLFVATALTLSVVPALYALWFGAATVEPGQGEATKGNAGDIEGSGAPPLAAELAAE